MARRPCDDDGEYLRKALLQMTARLKPGDLFYRFVIRSGVCDELIDWIDTSSREMCNGVQFQLNTVRLCYR